VLEFLAVAVGVHPLVVEELLEAEVALAQEVVLVVQEVLETFLLEGQELLVLFTQEPQVVEQV
jgi:hypothetical protein